MAKRYELPDAAWLWLLRSIKRKPKPKPKPGLARLFDRPKYRQRNIIERMFG